MGLFGELLSDPLMAFSLPRYSYLPHMTFWIPTFPLVPSLPFPLIPLLCPLASP